MAVDRIHILRYRRVRECEVEIEVVVVVAFSSVDVYNNAGHDDAGWGRGVAKDMIARVSVRPGETVMHMHIFRIVRCGVALLMLSFPFRDRVDRKGRACVGKASYCLRLTSFLLLPLVHPLP